MGKITKATPTQTKTTAPKTEAAMANPKNAESKANLSKTFGIPKK